MFKGVKVAIKKQTSSQAKDHFYKARQTRYVNDIYNNINEYIYTI